MAQNVSKQPKLNKNAKESNFLEISIFGQKWPKLRNLVIFDYIRRRLLLIVKSRTHRMNLLEGIQKAINASLDR